MGSADNILIGAGSVSIGGNDCGYTKGVRLRPVRDTWFRPYMRGLGYSEAVKLSETFIISTFLVEATRANILAAWDLCISDVGGVGVNKFRFGGSDTVTSRELVFTGVAPGTNKTRTITFFKCVSAEFGQIAMQRGKETVVPATFECLIDTSRAAGAQLGEWQDET